MNIINCKKIIGLIEIIVITVIILGCDNKAIKNNGEKILSNDPITSAVEQDALMETNLKKPDYFSLINNNYVLFTVNCGSESETKHDESETLGLYQSVSDQVFSKDLLTGVSWGYQPKEYMQIEKETSTSGENDYKWTIKEDVDYNPDETGFYYDFELPIGEYEITCGFNNPFSYRTIDISSEGERVINEKAILKYRNIEAAYTQKVTDGMLNIFINNRNRGKDAMKNPVVSYIIVRMVPDYSEEELQILINMRSIQDADRIFYSEKSLLNLDNKLDEAINLLDKHQSTKVQRKELFLAINKAFHNLVLIEVYHSFKPGNVWKDTEGNLIQAHGGQVQRLSIPDDETGDVIEKWWWVGEDKTLGYRGGICAYSSDDLYNWTFEGVVMRNVSSREQLENEEYFKKLYKGYTKEQLDRVYQCINDVTSVIERPKMIYNKKTNKYVIWFHADGPTTTSSANYAAASAGVAVSDSPYGPFRFIDRYRLNTCPSDQEDMYPESKGMARDMNLFVDDDDTAYIIYSSEENLTMYISRLNEDYTYLDTPVETAINGVDFIRLFPGDRREAPAVFKRNGIYYMITSGATGWNPNKARYYKSENILGKWTDMGDPCIGDVKETTFDSQSTCIFPVYDNKDMSHCQYIYMGDRWNAEDLTNSRYVWLPIHFDASGKISLEYQDEWNLELPE